MTREGGDHARSLDWRARHATLIRVAPREVLDEVTAKLQALVGPDA